MQKNLKILAATGVNYIHKYLYELPLGIFISQNFDLPYFNKYIHGNNFEKLNYMSLLD